MNEKFNKSDILGIILFRDIINSTMGIVALVNISQHSHYEELRLEYHWRSQLSIPYLQKQILRKIKKLTSLIYNLLSRKITHQNKNTSCVD